jgi:excisionase family DNA binding protein
MPDNVADVAKPPDLLTVGEVAERLRSSERTVQNWIATGRLRAIRIGGRLFVARPVIDEIVTAANDASASAGLRRFCTTDAGVRR